jgi:nicotinamide-nucleotide adenylyltransferase
MGKRGLIIGRFQPLHKGHFHLIREALKHVEEVVIGIGSTNVKNDDNPYSFEERVEKITQALKKHKLEDKVSAIIPITDHPDDDVWLKTVVRQVGKFDIAFGNNEWTNGIFEKAGYPVKRIPFFVREVYEGTKIRREMKTFNNPDAVRKKYAP